MKTTLAFICVLFLGILSRAQCNLLGNDGFELPPGAFAMEIFQPCSGPATNPPFWVSPNNPPNNYPWFVQCGLADFTTPDIMSEFFFGVPQTWDFPVSGAANDQFMRIKETEGTFSGCTLVSGEYNEALAQSLPVAMIDNQSYVLEYMTTCTGNCLTGTLGVFVDAGTNICNNAGPNGNFVPGPNGISMNYVFPNITGEWTHVVNSFISVNSQQSIFFTSGPANLLVPGQVTASMDYFVDDICLTPIAMDPISADAYIDVNGPLDDVCISGTFIVGFDVWTDWDGSNANPVTLELNYPLGSVFNVIPNAGFGGFFDNTGQLTIPAGQLTNSPTTYYAIVQFDGTQVNGQGICHSIDLHRHLWLSVP